MTIAELQNISIKTLPGVGAKIFDSYTALGVENLSDLILMRPKGYEDFTHRICIGETGNRFKTNTVVCVLSKSLFGKQLKSVKIIVQDTENGVRGELLGFNRTFLNNVLFEGQYYILRGVPLQDDGRGRFQFSQFEVIKISEEQAFFYADSVLNSGFMPLYTLSGVLTQKIIRRDIRSAFAKIDFIENDLPSFMYSKYSLMSKDEALRNIHFSVSELKIEQALKSLSFSEMFYLQLLALRSKKEKLRQTIPKEISFLEQKFVNSLPFNMTEDQLSVLQQIRQDMSTQQSMNRLLQGDVGAGKTLVAWVSALHVINENKQVAFMAPTELLARQHANNAKKMFAHLNVNVAYLDGQVHGSDKKQLLEKLKNGQIDLIIGTHALFSKNVVYSDLELVIIDEQHRFGVDQRKNLSQKGKNPHILLMSATPIPRTLALTVYGNLNVSSIRTMPQGRLPVKTFVINSERRDEVYSAVETELKRGHQAYFVFPRIEEDENKRSVEEMYSVITEKFPSFKGEMIHSRLSDEQKIKILNDFATGEIKYLVATSVVEVGLDVAVATCMVIEQANIFGLSALHQLRGRVGRSSLQSWCFLLYDSPLSEDAKKRLAIIKKTNNGFEIAEEDLRIRGPGEISGLKQSGFIHLKFSSLDEEKDLEMIKCIREEVKNILDKDPGLIELQNAVVRKCLQ